MKKRKEFLWVNKSGRGGTNTFNLTTVRQFFLQQWDWATGETVHAWSATAEVGDTWENAANKITRTK
jgi:hypothetical protein